MGNFESKRKDKRRIVSLRLSGRLLIFLAVMTLGKMFVFKYFEHFGAGTKIVINYNVEISGHGNAYFDYICILTN